MASNITIPDFDFSAFYYPEILEALINYKRIHVPELTEELPQEPFIQLLRAFALVGHLNNVLIDLIANESTLPTAKLADQVRNMLKLIDYEMSPASPAQADIVYELSKVFTTAFQVIPENAQASTELDADNPIIYYEALQALTIDRTDQFTAVFASEDGTFTDFTSKANSSTTPGDDWTPWSTPDVKDCIYFGHAHTLWDELGFTFTSPASGITGVWEFYDGDWLKTAPTLVTDIGGGQLEYDLTALLGTSNRAGTEVRVQLNETGAVETVFSTWDGSKNVATTGLLGQSVVSTSAADYSVGSDWTEVEGLNDGTSDLTLDGAASYTLPQSITQNWIRNTIEGQQAYWLRYRIVTVSTPNAPTIIRTTLDEGKQYVMRLVTQGVTQIDDPLGSSDGTANQRFPFTKENFVRNSDEIEVDGELWTRVEDFLSSKSGDKHYVIELTTNDRAVAVFGNGINGRIPPAGVGNITGTYRHNAQDNGNAGANTITVDKTGLTYVNRLWNPRQATGWTEAQGASEESLEQAKVEGPASLRIKDVAISDTDVEQFATTYIDDDGSSPFSRALAIEEGYGPKTIQLVVVAAGGGAASAEQLAALEEYMNGNKYSYPQVESHIVANQQVVAENYTPRPIDIEATVYGDVTPATVINRLQRVLQPEALKDDGVTWEWEYADTLPTSRIIKEIFDASESITNVVLNTPPTDVTLLTKELPVAGTISITIGS